MKKILLALALFATSFSINADEGMWLTKELNEQSIIRMKELGFTFPADSIYCETNPSLKDAVIILGNGCTGVVVSDKGLIFTNHHCGYDAIQKLSTVEYDYLKDGFVSQSFNEEMPAPGLTISFLHKTEDITEYIMSAISNEDDEMTRYSKVDSLSKEYLKQFEDLNFTEAKIVPFYNYNKYYLVVYKVFKDIRLVFTPPSSVGNFGNETDNWMWPRHTGDFSVFRVYADSSNNPAYFDEGNIPYTPKYAVPVSLKGYEEKSYAMTIGYPGRTQRYIPSWGIRQLIEAEHKPLITVRGVKQNIWKEAMNQSDTIRIKYASKFAISSNYWKNATGMNKSIDNLNIIEDKQKKENEFAQWINQKAERKSKYGETLNSLKDNYIESAEGMRIFTYLRETFYNGIEINRIAYLCEQLAKNENPNVRAQIKNMLADLFKDYDPPLDQKVTASLLKVYKENVPEEYLPTIYNKINNEFHNDFEQYADWLFKNSQIIYPQNIEKDSIDILLDPAIELSTSVALVFQKTDSLIKERMININKANREFMAGMMEMKTGLYPDANFTQRLSYGSVGGYSPADAISYKYYTTPRGILEKENKDDPEFAVEDYILEHIRSDNFDEYRDKNGEMHINFLSNNDITGGNSGSPVLNWQAHLIGLAFDGNWEALSGDVAFNPELQRCINVDIRYVLFMIDKVGKCTRLIDELEIIK